MNNHRGVFHVTKEVVLAGACRTPVGSFGGALKDIRAVDLGSIVMAEAIKRAGLKAEILDEVIFGCVCRGKNVAGHRNNLDPRE